VGDLMARGIGLSSFAVLQLFHLHEDTRNRGQITTCWNILANNSVLLCIL